MLNVLLYENQERSTLTLEMEEVNVTHSLTSRVVFRDQQLTRYQMM
jgi:hypothetical protein